eukprot:scaffold888_cov569-Prasinococcus_capsulatus_cf.AAC.26
MLCKPERGCARCTCRVRDERGTPDWSRAARRAAGSPRLGAVLRPARPRAPASAARHGPRTCMCSCWQLYDTAAPRMCAGALRAPRVSHCPRAGPVSPRAASIHTVCTNDKLRQCITCALARDSRAGSYLSLPHGSLIGSRVWHRCRVMA